VIRRDPTSGVCIIQVTQSLGVGRAVLPGSEAIPWRCSASPRSECANRTSRARFSPCCTRACPSCSTGSRATAKRRGRCQRNSIGRVKASSNGLGPTGSSMERFGFCSKPASSRSARPRPRAANPASSAALFHKWLQRRPPRAYLAARYRAAAPFSQSARTDSGRARCAPSGNRRSVRGQRPKPPPRSLKTARFS